jgi:hypothetical protein
VGLVNEQYNRAAVVVFLLECLIKLEEHGGGIVCRTIEATFLANKRQDIPERQPGVPNKERPQTRLDSGLTGMQNGCFSESRCTAKRQQTLPSFNTANERM